MSNDVKAFFGVFCVIFTIFLIALVDMTNKGQIVTKTCVKYEEQEKIKCTSFNTLIGFSTCKVEKENVCVEYK